MPAGVQYFADHVVAHESAATFLFASSSTGEAATQTSTARLGVLLGFTILPALLVAAGLPLIRRYAEDAMSGQPIAQ